jgi:hypothetical protein
MYDIPDDMLDDVRTKKCVRIAEEIRADSEWRVLKESSDRNGYLIGRGTKAFP